MKETFYFSHDYNARSDDKIKKLIRKHNLLGYGAYWAIIEDLYNNANALQTDYEGIAFDLRTNEQLVESIIQDFDLFIIKDNTFYSESVNRRLDDRAEKSANARKAAEIRWEKQRQLDANALQTQSNGNAIKESKETKESILLKDISSPPDGVDILHFYIAKGFYNLFLLKGKTRTLLKAKVNHWVKIIRLLINEDNVTIEQLVAIKYYFEKCQQGDRSVKTWWFENINSVAAFRKKNKDNEYHYDKITIDIKKWVEASPDVQAEIFSRTNKLKEKTA